MARVGRPVPRPPVVQAPERSLLLLSTHRVVVRGREAVVDAGGRQPRASPESPRPRVVSFRRHPPRARCDAGSRGGGRLAEERPPKGGPERPQHQARLSDASGGGAGQGLSYCTFVLCSDAGGQRLDSRSRFGADGGPPFVCPSATAGGSGVRVRRFRENPARAARSNRSP